MFSNTFSRLKLAPASILLLALGIITRCVVYVYLDPSNNDKHIAMVQYMVEHKTFPPLETEMLAFHPPLYYWLAAPVLAVSGSGKAVQFLSLISSILTLVILYQLVYKTEFIASPRARLYALLMACFLPQFILFGLYLSNDSLAFLLGSLTALQVCRYLRSPDWKQVIVLGVVTGLGLLTKTTFLVFLPVLMVMVLFVQFRERRSVSGALAAAAVFLLVSSALGCYKYVDNTIQYGSPFVNSLDHPRDWAEMQKRSYRGWPSFFSFNLERLVVSPAVSEVTESSYPLLLYGTFWYPHIPESNFIASQLSPYFYVGSAIYIVALVPTFVALLGFLALTFRLPGFLRAFDRKQASDRRLMAWYITAGLLLANVALVFATVARYHVWGLMQGRYLFPAFAGCLAVLALGLDVLEKNRNLLAAVNVSMRILVTLFGLCLLTDIGYLVGSQF